MLIVSNFKDYYDFLIAKYGVDERLVYNRHLKVFKNNEGRVYNYSDICWEKNAVIQIAFCGIIYIVVKFEYQFYYNVDFNLLPDDVKDFVLDYNKRCFSILIRNHDYSKTRKKTEYQFANNLKHTTLNETHNEPILLLKDNCKVTICSNIKLMDYGLQKILSPEEVYLQIYQFISKEKLIIDKRNNIEKLLSNGFDVKTSFRNVK